MTKIGNFTVITRPVTWEQAPKSCAMLGLRLAKIDIENFIDATNGAFQCSGPFSQSWVHSWNGDASGGSPLVLSTGSAVPGGAINLVTDGSVSRNAICEVSPEPVVKPRCGEHADEGHEHGSGCGCAGSRGLGCGCSRHGHHERKPVLHGKMKCLRCFCRNQVECPVLDGENLRPVVKNPTHHTASPAKPIASTPAKTHEKEHVAHHKDQAKEQKEDKKQMSHQKEQKPAEQKKESEIKDDKTAKALKAIGRFFHVQDTKDAGDEQVHDDGDAENIEGEDGEDGGEDDYYSDEDQEIEEVIFDQEEKNVAKGLPFPPQTCGSQCVCYACKDFEPERRRHHGRHHHSGRDHSHHDDEDVDDGDLMKKSAMQMKSMKAIASFDNMWHVSEDHHHDHDGQMKIQIQDL